MTTVPGYQKGRMCKACGCHVSDKGRNSKSGDYFCSKELCKTQRQRERQRRLRQESKATMARWHAEHPGRKPVELSDYDAKMLRFYSGMGDEYADKLRALKIRVGLKVD